MGFRYASFFLIFNPFIYIKRAPITAFIIQMKLLPKRDRKRELCKTQPDELECEIRVSLGEEAKQRLREISCVNNLGGSRSRDWTLDQLPAFKLSATESKRLETASFCNREGQQQGQQGRRPLQLGLRLRDADYMRRLNRTQGSMRGKDEETERRGCNSVTVNFDAGPKEKQTRIHSNGQAHDQIQFENMAFNISDKTLKEATHKLQSRLGKTRILFSSKEAKSKVDRTRTPLPYRKLACRTVGGGRNALLSQTQFKPVQAVSLKSDFTLTKEFIDLRVLLMEERKSIFYPTKASLTVKHRGRGRGCS